MINFKEDIPENSVKKPDIPPKAPPAPPMLNSEKKQYVDKIRILQEELELVQTATLMKVRRLIRTCEYLSEEQKDLLIEEINK